MEPRGHLRYQTHSARSLAGVAFVAASWWASLGGAEPTAQGVAVWELFSSGQYERYLEHLDAEIGNRPASWLRLNLTKVMATAVALDKAKQREGPLAARAERHLCASPDALRYFHAFKRLLGGDVAAAALFFDGEPPRYSVWSVQSEWLRKHGYPTAAHVFDALYMTGGTGMAAWQEPGVLETGVRALAALSREDRERLDSLLRSRFKENWAGQREVVQAALRLVGEADAVASEAYLDIADRYGRELDAIPLSRAADLAHEGKPRVALKLAALAAAARPEDMDRQLEASRLFIRYAPPEQTAVYCEQALRRMPSPFGRGLRVEYLRWLSTSGLNDRLSAVAQGMDEIVAAEVLAVQGDNQEAALRYRRLSMDGRRPVEARLEALAGWAEIDTTGALSAADALVELPCPPGALHWFGWHMWSALQQALGLLPPEARIANSPAAPRDIRAQPDIGAAASLFDKVISKAPTECLRGEVRTGARSLRVPAAVLSCLSGARQKALARLLAPVTYVVPPPPGGWRNPPGTPAPADADRPRTFTGPRLEDVGKWSVETLDALSHGRAATTQACVAETGLYFLAHLPAGSARVQSGKAAENEAEKVGVGMLAVWEELLTRTLGAIGAVTCLRPPEQGGQREPGDTKLVAELERVLAKRMEGEQGREFAGAAERALRGQVVRDPGVVAVVERLTAQTQARQPDE